MIYHTPGGDISIILDLKAIENQIPDILEVSKRPGSMVPRKELDLGGNWDADERL